MHEGLDFYLDVNFRHALFVVAVAITCHACN